MKMEVKKANTFSSSDVAGPYVDGFGFITVWAAFLWFISISGAFNEGRHFDEWKLHYY